METIFQSDSHGGNELKGSVAILGFLIIHGLTYAQAMDALGMVQTELSSYAVIWMEEVKR